MKIMRVMLMLAATSAFAFSASAQSAGDKATGQGGTNGQEGPSTDKSAGPAGKGTMKSKHHHSKHHHKKSM